MLELVHGGHGNAFSGDFDRCAQCKRVRLCSLWLSVFVLYKCGDHPSCHSDWCMGSLCVPLSYLSESSAVHCGACLLHLACGCPLSEAIGCERGGDLCLKGGEARPEEGGGGGGLVLATEGVNVWSITGTQPWRDWSPKAASAKLGTLCCVVYVDVL